MHSEDIKSNANSIQHGYIHRYGDDLDRWQTRNQAQYKKQKLNNVKKLPKNLIVL